ILLKPTTYMNLSGKAVNYWLQKENIAIDHLLVVVDDLALPLGSIRLRAKGSDAGHNGLKNITEVLGTQDYARLRIGIGDNFRQGQQIDYVLGEWDKQEKLELPAMIDTSVEIIKSFGTIGVHQTMTFFNKRK
ncbi:MAG: aminoacyl-tRNA hydrolase, partial [Bacteroidota bacterium]|nr:aminoacyl-tRNA hydrolase [Bacteroidota bacterium]